MPLTIDLPPDLLAALIDFAAKHGRTPADEATWQLSVALSSAAATAVRRPPEAADWSGDPLAEALREKIERLRTDPDAFSNGAADPFVAALEAERAGAATASARDAA